MVSPAAVDQRQTETSSVIFILWLMLTHMNVSFERSLGMAELEIEAAIDDYLHTIVRTRPWTKAREEDLLTSFSDWLYEQPGHSVELASVTPEVVRHYSETRGLGESEQSELQATMGKLLIWAEVRGHIQSNPFGAKAAA
jgi:hypothetical protein